MTIDSIAADCENAYSLSEWIESEKAGQVQKHLEEKIMTMLFSQDPASSDFLQMIIQFARIGSRPEAKALLEREIIPLNFSNDFSVEQCRFWKEVGKGSRIVGSFIANHSVEIAVGAAICATGIGIAYVTGYTLSACVGGIVVAGANSVFHHEKKPDPKIPSVPPPCSKEELALLRQTSSTSLAKIEFPSSANELLITTDGIWANGQFFPTDSLMKHSLTTPLLANSQVNGGFSSGPDWKTFTYYTYLSQQIGQETIHSYHVRGDNALALGYYNQAVQDFGKAIVANPTNPQSYLERGAALFNLEQYDASLEDYQQFASQTPTYPLAVSEFSLGFAKGLPKGIYDSGEGVLLFFTEFATHPIQTSKQVIDSVTTLANLVRKDEWAVIAETLSPEIYQLVTQWDTLPSDKRGELAGYAIGKHGADILTPGAIGKVAKMSMKSAQELAAVCKNLKIAQETLILETAAGIGNGAKIGEIIQAGKTTTALGEELGFTSREMGQLKQAGKLETTVSNHYEHLSPALKETAALYKDAEKVLKPYSKQAMPEFQVRELIQANGIPTFPRPKGIPEGYLVMVSDRGAGMEYVHPTNTHIRIRVMPGKPHSPFPHQQKPYVIQKKDGKAFDKHGNLVSHESPEAHISVNEFFFRE